MTSKPSTLAEYVAELDRLIEQPLPSFDPMNPNSAMKFVKASILKNHRLNTAGVLRDLVETAGDRPLAPRTTWTDRDGLQRPAILSYDEAMQQAIDWNLTAVELEKTLSAAQDRLTRAEGDVEYGRRYCQRLADELEHEQEANARLLKTIEEVCEQRDQLERELNDMGHVAGGNLDLLEATERERDEALGKLDEVQGRLSDLMSYITDEEQPESEPEPGQCWRSINKSYIYRQVDNQVLLWGPSSDTALHGRQWVETVFESLRDLEDHIGDLEPVDNPENAEAA